MPTGKTVAEHILDICKLIREDLTELRKQVGEDNMQSLDKRLTRLETKTTSMIQMMEAKEQGIVMDDGGMDRILR